MTRVVKISSVIVAVLGVAVVLIFLGVNLKSPENGDLGNLSEFRDIPIEAGAEYCEQNMVEGEINECLTFLGVRWADSKFCEEIEDTSAYNICIQRVQATAF